ncbi:MAG: DnaA N-terminal domain-containing protein, partial [Pseudomonadota bacterium]
MSASAAAAAWARVRTGLRHSAGARLFDQWLKPIALVETGDPDVIRLTLPSAFMTNWVKSHYAERLLHEFRAILPGVRSVAIETAATTAVIEVLAPGPVQAAAPAAATRPRPVL